MARAKRKLSAEINVVPYIDVMLVLLVIFMVTAPLLMQGVKVELPQAPAKPIDQKDEEPLIVSLKQDGTYYLNIGAKQDQALPLAEIKQKVALIMKSKPQTSVLVWGDKRVEYGIVVSLMAELQASGVPNVGLVTEDLAK